MINTDYGVMAKEVVQERYEFNFLLSCKDYKRESDLVATILRPQSFTEAEVKDAYSKFGTSPMGKGRLKILASKIIPAKETADHENLGQIAWMKFEVDLTFPITGK